TSNNATAPGMTLAASNQVGWQYVPGSGWMQTTGGRAQTLAEQGQAWQQQADVAKAASNPRDYIYAQMLGGARGGLAGQAPTNQMTATTPMPGQQLPGAQPGQMMWPQQPGQMPGQLPGGMPFQGLTRLDRSMPQWGAQPGMGGQPGQPMDGQMPDGMASISPVNPATGLRFDENTGQYTSEPLPTAEQNVQRRLA